MNKKSLKLYARAKKVIPGGVNSPVRAFLSVNQKPFFVKKAHGQYLVDEDNNKIIDYIGSWGAQILGHGHSKIKNTLTASLRKGITYGAPCSREVELAERITKIYPSINKVRMVSSGTEATMSAIRLARGYTGRNKILKFNGCYHGHGDSFLIKAGSGAATFGVPNSLGVPPGLAKETISTNFNDIESVKKVVKKYKLACIIVEPIAGNMNFIRSDENFLHELRTICSENDIVLIFDEVMTGFRVALGGAQSLYSIKPDLTTLGKVLGGGLPVGAFGGKSKIMNQLSPDGGVYQAGTLSGNPLAMDAGLKTLDLISKRNYFKNLEKITRQLTDGINELSRKYNKKIYADSQGGMFGIYFTDKKVVNYESISKSDIKKFIQFFKFMLKNKIYFAGGHFAASRRTSPKLSTYGKNNRGHKPW